MIRIDEIYQNVFLPRISSRLYHSAHWFDPFGSTKYEDICSMPVISGWRDDLDRPNYESVRYLFWDQEPLHNADATLEKFCKIYAASTNHVVTSEKNSEYVDAVCKKFNLKSHYYFFHAWAALDWYRGYDRSLLYRPFKDRDIRYNFLCLNNIIGGGRKHRILLLKELVERDLINDNLVSFPQVCPFENLSVSDLCKKYQIDLDLSGVNLPLIVDDNTGHHLNSHKIDLWSQADQSLIQVVTETVYHGKRQHLTEKSFKPIVMQQPFILVSCQGSLDYLRGYGFKTFGDLWDESYDEKTDADRIPAIGQLIDDLSNLSDKEIASLQKNLIPIVEHNFNWFYSKEFEELLWKELSEILDDLQ